VLVVLIVLYIGSQLLSSPADAVDGDKNQRMLMLGLPVRLHVLHHQLPGRPHRLLDHDTNL